MGLKTDARMWRTASARSPVSCKFRSMKAASKERGDSATEGELRCRLVVQPHYFVVYSLRGKKAHATRGPADSAERIQPNTNQPPHAQRKARGPLKSRYF